MSRTFALASASGLDSKQDRNAMHIQVTQGSRARERRLSDDRSQHSLTSNFERYLYESEPQIRRIRT